MQKHSIFDSKALDLQIQRQKKYAWDLEKDIDWARGVDTTKYFLPLDTEALAFPGASAAQRLALSQFLGLVINATIAELEDVINKLKFEGWNKILRKYPVNPEVFELGELFFEEEKKHSVAFYRYIDLFCQKTGVSRSDLNKLLPKSFGSLFLSLITKNAKMGGLGFWWVVAAVEEVSIEVYREIHKQRMVLDPLYVQVHLRHMEEESRHHNYAFMMLDLANRQRSGWLASLMKKGDLLLGQTLTSGWVLAELNRFTHVEKIRNNHPYFETLASCIPLLKKVPVIELLRRLFIEAPYISLMLNPRYHRETMKMADSFAVPRLPIPEPYAKPTFTEKP